MASQIPTDEYLRELAAESEYTLGEAGAALDDFQAAVQADYYNHYRKCYLRTGKNYHLFRSNSGDWFAFGWREMQDIIRESDYEVDINLMHRIGIASLDYFQEHWEMTIEISRQIAQRRKEPMFYPIFVPFPDDWGRARLNATQELERLIWRFEMSPAEALDYYMVEHSHLDDYEWAGRRDVGIEAIQKNVRQAESKLEDSELGATHDANQINAVPVEELPDDGVRHEERDTYLVPTEGHLENVES